MANRERELAEAFILHTDRNVFLTGRAGTGKTTLLHDIVSKTKKKHIIVAPTGVAAINAGGMTIHSTFQLPPSNFVPSRDSVDPDRFVNHTMLPRHQKLVRNRIDLLRNIDLLIIDEISMVRADLLDVIDHTLRRVRRSKHAFGGVQVVVIGDLYQLAPVMKSDVWEVLSKYYRSPYFFDSLAWQQSFPIMIELKKVYRQRDETFVQILNNIRQGRYVAEEIAMLNARFTETPDLDQSITLSTHNRSADKINADELDKIDDEEIVLEANIRGNFPKSAFPVPELIKVKPQAQIMFVKNHSGGLWYNGKLATVISETEEGLLVEDEDEKRILIEAEEWSNTRYKLDKKTKEITQENLGTYIQYPVKLAWAVTVHKSQGLTFDKVAVDLARTFAPGQLYVALSRCRSLEGLTLTSRISARNIMVDNDVDRFYAQHDLPDDIDAILARAKAAYEDRQLYRTFDLDKLLAYTHDWEAYIYEQDVQISAKSLQRAKKVIDEAEKLQETATTFQKQLGAILAQTEDEALRAQQVHDRGHKAITYFTLNLYEQVVKPVAKEVERCKGNRDLRKYKRMLENLLNEYWDRIEMMYEFVYRGEPVFKGEAAHKRQKLFDADSKEYDMPSDKVKSYEITLDLIQSGKSIEEVAEIRDLATSTIESHIGKLIAEDKLDIYDVLDVEKIEKCMPVVQDNLDLELSFLRNKMPILLTFGEARWLKKWVENKTKG